MSNTTIQIRRSTSANTPASLAQGELAFTSNGDTLWVGSPSGSNTANVIHIGAKISYVGNATHLGSSTTGSNSELASTYAIKNYVANQIGSFTTTLAGLTDVDVTDVANNSLLIYNASASKWEDHAISGTANQVNVSFSSQNITVGLPDDVTISANLTVNNGLYVTGNSEFSSWVYVQVGGEWTPHSVTNPILQAEANTDNWTQVSIQNRNPGVNASADFIAYPNNTLADDNTGFIDLGITSNGYSQAAYSITKPNDGYLFASARAGDNLGGSLVLATDSTGTNNDIKFFVGGFTYNHDQPHMVLTGNNRNLGIGNANPEYKISVEGTARFNGTTITQDLLPIANNTYRLGNNDFNWAGVYAQTIVANQGLFTNVAGTITTSNQPNISNVGTLVALTVTNTTTLNGNVSLGSDSSDVVSVNGVVNTNIVASANVTYDLGTSTKQWRSIYSGNGYFNDVTVSGNLVINGTLTTIDSTNLVVEDSLIKLARNQANTGTFVDAVDIGFYGTYGNTSQTVYTGLARDSSANVYVLFDGLVNQSPDNVVNTAAITVSTLTAYLNSGGLSTNSTAVSITANSTVSVAITANTLSLTTALGVASGGTGRATLSNNAVVVGNGTGQVTLVSSSTEGHVLQINSSGAPTFGGLDGGTF